MLQLLKKRKATNPPEVQRGSPKGGPFWGRKPNVHGSQPQQQWQSPGDQPFTLSPNAIQPHNRENSSLSRDKPLPAPPPPSPRGTAAGPVHLPRLDVDEVISDSEEYPVPSASSYTGKGPGDKDLVDKTQIPPPSPRQNLPPTPPPTPPPKPISLPTKVLSDGQACRALLLELSSQKKSIPKDLIEVFTKEESQNLIDFLHEVLENRGDIEINQSKRILYMFSKVAKFAQVAPVRLELRDVRFDRSKPDSEGSFGLVYEGYCGKSVVCVKVPRVYEYGDNSQKLRVQAAELSYLAHISHPNIVPFLGIHFSNEKVPKICIITQWMRNRDLNCFLLNHPDRPRLPLLFDVISGMHYLHMSKIIHADIKGANILVSDAGRAMITDLGISRVMLTDHTSGNGSQGTLRWKAPELVKHGASRPTAESDIWSFACVCLEVLTGQAPFCQLEDDYRVLLALMNDEIPANLERPNVIPDAVWNILRNCWDCDPKQRPTAEDIVLLFTNLNIPSNSPSADESSSNPSTIKAVKPLVEIEYERVYELLQHIQQSTPTEADVKADQAEVL